MICLQFVSIFLFQYLTRKFVLKTKLKKKALQLGLSLCQDGMHFVLEDMSAEKSLCSDGTHNVGEDMPAKKSLC